MSLVQRRRGTRGTIELVTRSLFLVYKRNQTDSEFQKNSIA
ncbi:unnamed protein product, partial [Allacma fusca]